jgi:hypothetical protein
VLVSGSAVGYYGANTGDAEMTEASPPGRDALADMCVAWEAAADPARAAGVRVVHPRIGIVLDPDGGALPQMALPFKLFVGGKIGSGKQWLPWVHHADMTAMLLFMLDAPTLWGPVTPSFRSRSRTPSSAARWRSAEAGRTSPGAGVHAQVSTRRNRRGGRRRAECAAGCLRS